ncbi:MAG: hypothetical protein Ct9H300mP8_06430 [Gammaproteobacteria bacterium]|nr:MAG: hypothetical protein Ct9H300mP8_06430 [Gammaproteobacteria bacterium]
MTLNLKRDDGAIAYLNGTEIARDGLPAGTVGLAILPPMRPMMATTSSLYGGKSLLWPGARRRRSVNRRKTDWSYLDEGDKDGWTASDFETPGLGHGCGRVGLHRR